MRAGPAFLQFDWSKAGLSMDLPVFVYSHTKTSFRFLSRQRKYREAFYVVTDLLLQATQREPYMALVLSRLRLSRSTDHKDIVRPRKKILQEYQKINQCFFSQGWCNPPIRKSWHNLFPDIFFE